MRLFIAITLPKDVREHLTQLQKRFTNAGKITFTKEQHLTLKFLGEVTPTKTKQVEQRLSKITFQHFSLTLSGIGFFPDETNARVLWVGLQLNQDILDLQKKIDTTLEKDFDKENNFVPHLTLGRITSITNTTQFHKLAQGTRVQPLKIPVKEFQLIESKLSTQGPVYRIITTFPAQPS